jgi:hypothetical protein
MQWRYWTAARPCAGLAPVTQRLSLNSLNDLLVSDPKSVWAFGDASTIIATGTGGR